MHDITDALEVHDNDDGLSLIGYVKQISQDVWLPIDLQRETIAGPSHKQDAINIVRLNNIKQINT